MDTKQLEQPMTVSQEYREMWKTALQLAEKGDQTTYTVDKHLIGMIEMYVAKHSGSDLIRLVALQEIRLFIADKPQYDDTIKDHLDKLIKELRDKIYGEGK